MNNAGDFWKILKYFKLTYNIVSNKNYLKFLKKFDRIIFYVLILLLIYLYIFVIEKKIKSG
jgi:hypothetical protein